MKYIISIFFCLILSVYLQKDEIDWNRRQKDLDWLNGAGNGQNSGRSRSDQDWLNGAGNGQNNGRSRSDQDWLNGAGNGQNSGRSRSDQDWLNGAGNGQNSDGSSSPYSSSPFNTNPTKTEPEKTIPPPVSSENPKKDIFGRPIEENKKVQDISKCQKKELSFLGTISEHEIELNKQSKTICLIFPNTSIKKKFLVDIFKVSYSCGKKETCYYHFDPMDVCVFGEDPRFADSNGCYWSKTLTEKDDELLIAEDEKLFQQDYYVKITIQTGKLNDPSSIFNLSIESYDKFSVFTIILFVIIGLFLGGIIIYFCYYTITTSWCYSSHNDHYSSYQPDNINNQQSEEKNQVNSINNVGDDAKEPLLPQNELNI